MSRYLESAAARNQEDGSARVLESGAVGGAVDLAGSSAGASTASGTLSVTAAAGLPITETWTGSNGTPWPTPKWSVTKAWPQYSVTDTIQGNRGRLVVGANPYAFGLAELAGSAHTDVEITFTYAIADATRESYTEVFYRMDHTGTIGDPASSGWPIDCYAIDIEPQINTVFLANLDAGGIGVNIATVASAGVNVTTDIKFRILAVGSNHKVRWWPATGTEPSTWQINVNDSTWTSGHFALGLYEGDYVGGFNQAEFDDLRVAAPTVATTLMKGVGAIPDANTATDLDTLNVSWWYEWDNPTTHAHVSPPGYEYVPMMWGDWDRTYPGFDIGGTPAEAIGTSRVLLGFNEPNIPSQADMTVARCLELWPQMEATGARLGSPACSPNGGQEAYLDAFFAGNPRVDFLCLHWYPEYDAGYPNIGNYLDHYHTRYGLPIWLTEITAGTTGSIADSAALINTAMAACASRPWVERIAWFFLARDPGAAGWPNSSLVNSDGSLNAAGTVYASYPPGEIVYTGGPVALGGSAAGTSTAAGTMAVGRSVVGSSAGTSTAAATMAVSRSLVATPAAGSSTAAGTVAVARAMVAVASAGTSTAAATMAVARTLVGSSAGTSTAGATEVNAIALAGTSAGTSVASGTMVGSSVQALAGDSAGTSLATGTTVVARALVGSSAGTSTVTGAMAVTRSLNGSAAATSTAAATSLATVRALVGSSAGSSAATAALAEATALVGSSAGSGAATGTLQTTAANQFSGASNGTSTATGAMGVAQSLISAAGGTSTAAGTLVRAVPLTAVAAAGSSTASASLVTTRALAGSSAGSSTATSSGSRTAVALAGNSAGAGGSTANLTVFTPTGFSGTVAGTSTAVGTLATAVRLAGSSAGTGTASGTLVRAVPLVASSAGTSTVAAVPLVRNVGLGGSAAGSSNATGALSNKVGLSGDTAGSSDVAAAAMAVARGLSGYSNGLSVASGTLQVIFIAPVYGLWNGQPFDAMQYGDKPVTAWLMLPS